MVDFVANIAGEDFYSYKSSNFNPWDGSSLRTKLEIWAHKNKINNLNQVNNLLVHYFFGALLTMPYMNAYSEIKMADIFYKKTMSSIKVLTFTIDSASLPQVKAFVIQTGVQQSAGDFEFQPCEITWMYNYIRKLGENAISSKHFLKNFNFYYLLEFGRPNNGIEYEIFTSNGILQMFKSNPKSPLRVSVQKKDVESLKVDVQMNGDLENCGFNVLQPFPEHDFDAQVSRFLEDKTSALDHIRSIFESLSDWYIQYRTIFKMTANVDSFLSFCYGALEYHIAQNSDLELFRMRQDYGHTDALYLKWSKHLVTNENSHPVIKCVVSNDNEVTQTPHIRMHSQESESYLPMLTSKHSTIKVVVSLTHLMRPFVQTQQKSYRDRAFSVQQVPVESAPRKNFIIKMIELSRTIDSASKDAKKYVASEIENLKILTQTDKTNHSISFHLLGQILGIKDKDNKSLFKTFFKHENPISNHFITTFTIRGLESSTIVVINILENDYGRASLSSIFEEIGKRHPIIEDKIIEKVFMINIRSSVNLFPLRSFDKEYLLFKKIKYFDGTIGGRHEELPHFGVENLLNVLDKAKEEVMYVEKMELFRNLKPLIKSSSDFSSIIQGVLTSKLEFDIDKMDGRVVFKFFSQGRINQIVVLAPEWDIIDNVTHFGKCAMHAIRGIFRELYESHKDENITVISMVHQHLADDQDMNIIQIAKISNLKESARRVLDRCYPKYTGRQKRAISDCFYVRYSRPDDMIELQEVGSVTGSVKTLNSQQMAGVNEMAEPQPGPSGLQRQPSLTSIDGAESRAGPPISENVRQKMKSAYNRIIQKSVSQMSLVSTSPTVSNFLRFFPQDLTTAKKRAFQSHRDRMFKILKAYMYSRMGSNIVAGFINKDYAMVGINAGLLSTTALPYFTRSLLKKGETLLGAGRLFAGVSRVGAAITAPRVGIMGLVIYSLVDNAGRHKSGNEEALVSVIGDSLILSFELTSIGLQIAGKFFTKFMLVASVVNPIVVLVTTFIFIGIDIYLAVRTVDKMDEIIPLSSREKVDLGVMAFFHVDHRHLENLRRSKIHNINTAINVMDIFQQSNGSVKYTFRPRTRTNSRDETVFYEDNVLNLRTNSTLISRVWPNPIVGMHVVAMDDEYAHLNNNQGDKRSVFSCKDMIGFNNDNAHPNATQVIVNLGDGHDTAYGFKDAADHIFILGNGNKFVEGGNGIDNFVLSGDQWTVGQLYGVGGLNMVNMTLYAMDKDIHINMTENYGYISNIHQKKPDAGNSLLISNIQEFIGREKAADKISCSCDTRTIYLKGGRSEENMDKIYFGKSCNYSTKIILTPPVLVNNSESTKGVFHYIVEDKVGLSEIQLPKQNTTTEHDFLFNIEILDLVDMNIDRSNGRSDLSMSVEADHDDNTGPKMFHLIIKNINHNLMFLFNDFALMAIVGDTGYVNQTTHKTVDNILAHYPEAADRLGLSMRVHSLKSKAIVIMGHSKIDTKSEIHSNLALVNTLKNDPKTTSHLVGCTMKSIYMLMCTQDGSNDLPRTAAVIIHNYFLTPNSNNILFTSGFDEAVAKIAKTRPTFKLEVSGNDLLVNVTIKEDNANRYITKIVIKDALVEEHYKKLIIARRRPMFIIKNNEGSFQLVPKSLEYNETSVMVTEYQIEPHMNIIVNHPIGAYTFLKSGVNLIISNTLDTNSHDHLYIMVTLIGFYGSQDMLTLTINFKDRDLVLAGHIDAINSAADFHFTLMDSSNDHTDYSIPDYDESEEYTG